MNRELPDKFLFKVLLNIVNNKLPDKEKAVYKETIFRKTVFYGVSIQDTT